MTCNHTTNHRTRNPSTFTVRLAVLSATLAVAATLFMALPAAAASAPVGAVYTMSNDPGGNEVIIFDRFADGSVKEVGSVSTGGAGTGAGLGNQGGLTLVGERWLLAVNAGSDSISVFRVREPRGLTLKDVEPSGGSIPISVTAHKGLVYVLNAGGDGSIAGFWLSEHGDLEPIAGSLRPLSSAAPAPAQIGFGRDGDVLIVTEKATNTITTYVVDESSGIAGPPHGQPSAGQTPFGFDFDHEGNLVVSEAFGGALNASAVSSYEVGDDGALQVISPSVPTYQTAACWILVTGNGRHAYTTNFGSDTVGGFQIGHGGRLHEIGATVTGAGPLDMAAARNGRFIYTLDAGDGSVTGFRYRSDGSLELEQQAFGLPSGANGLAAR